MKLKITMQGLEILHIFLTIYIREIPNKAKTNNLLVYAQSLQSRLTLCNPQSVACLAPLSMEFSRQEYWSGLPCSAPGDFPQPVIKPTSPALQVNSLPLSHHGNPSTCIMELSCWHYLESSVKFLRMQILSLHLIIVW